MYSSLFKKIIYPTYHMVKRDNVWSLTRDLERNQWKTGEELAILQQKKLEALLQHAFANVPYYMEMAKTKQFNHETMSKPDHFKKISFLTKPVIRNKLNALISKNLSGNKVFPSSTSGSTGEALYFLTDTRSLAYKKACVNRNDKWAGCNPGDKMIKLWGAQMDIAKTESLRGRLHATVRRVRFLSSYDLTPSKMDEYIDIIISFKPKTILSYPGPLEVFAKHVETKKTGFPFLQSVITSAEQLFDYQRALFEKIFKAKVYNRYGSREFGNIAQECGCNSGLHVNSDRFLVEILDENGEPAQAGETGELFITDLDNYGMPLIRYRIGDTAAWAQTQSCPCKRGFPLLSKIEGRSLDVIKTPSNHSIGGTYWTILFKSKHGIKKFQVVQNTLSGIIINYIPDKPFDPEILNYFEGQIKKKCGQGFHIAFKETDKIETTRAGKNKIIVSYVNE